MRKRNRVGRERERDEERREKIFTLNYTTKSHLYHVSVEKRKLHRRKS